MVEILLWLHCHASREGDQNVLFDASKGLAIRSRNPIISENPEIGNCMPIDLYAKYRVCGSSPCLRMGIPKNSVVQTKNSRRRV